MVTTMSDHRYAAVFGRNATLSLAELEALGEQPQSLNDQSALISGANHQRFGSTVKVVELLNRTVPNSEEILDVLVADVKSDAKLRFGISIYGQADIGGLLTRAKRCLKERGISSGFVQSREPLSLAQVKHNQLVGKGVEWCLFQTGDGWRGGRTIWIPDFEAFAKRDYDKPKSDTKRGMLPPQLARTMVNVATQGKPIAVYDPFCGVGGLLLESAALGHVTYGSDIDPKAVADAKQNLAWLNPDVEWDVTVHDATKPLPIGKPVVIATEGFLGELVAPKTPDERITKTVVEVEATMLQFFEAAHKTLTPGQRLVITLPAWKTAAGVVRPEVVDRILALGYTKVRPSIDVSRPKQRVIHELFIFERA